MDKYGREFKRKEMEHELGHEDKWNKAQANKPVLKGYYFYNVPENDRDTAASYGIKQLKSGKWGMPIYDKSGASTAYRKRLADDAYGKGRWWEPKPKTNEDAAGKISRIDGSGVTIDTMDPQSGIKQQTTIPKDKIDQSLSGGSQPGQPQSPTLSRVNGKLTLNTNPSSSQHPGQQPPGQSGQSQPKPLAVGDQVDDIATMKKNAGIA